jgi:hypothetical protein
MEVKLNQYNLNNSNDNVLDVKVQHYGECGFCGDIEEALYIPWSIWSDWLWLMSQMGSLEWGAVYNVKTVKTSKANVSPIITQQLVTDYLIPKQEVTAGSIDFPDRKQLDNFNGFVHSHHGLNVSGHSGQDDEHERRLFDYSIVLSHTGYVASRQIKTPCGGFGYVKVKIFITGLPKIDDGNITDKNNVIVVGGQYQYWLEQQESRENKHKKKADTGKSDTHLRTLYGCKEYNNEGKVIYGDEDIYKNVPLDVDACTNCGKQGQECYNCAVWHNYWESFD